MGRGADLGERPGASRFGPAARPASPQRPAAGRLENGGRRRVWRLSVPRRLAPFRALRRPPHVRHGQSRRGWGEGACAFGGARGGLAAGGSASPPAACGLHPSPVVHCCFRGGGRVAALRGLGPAARALRGASPSPPGARRAARITTAGALGYEWSGAGQRRPSVTAAGGG